LRDELFGVSSVDKSQIAEEPYPSVLKEYLGDKLKAINSRFSMGLQRMGAKRAEFEVEMQSVAEQEELLQSDKRHIDRQLKIYDERVRKIGFSFLFNYRDRSRILRRQLRAIKNTWI
jgi:hypothetical protein